MKLNSKKYPYTISKEIERTFAQVRSIVVDNITILRYTENSNLFFGILDKDDTSDFHFIIKSIRIKQGKTVHYRISVLPGTGTRITPAGKLVNSAYLLLQLEEWVRMIKDYNHIGNTLGEWWPAGKQNATTEPPCLTLPDLQNETPLDKNKQLLVKDLLQNIQARLEPDKLKPKVLPLWAESIEIKRCLATGPQSQILQRLLHLLNHLRSIGLLLLKEVLMENAKELVQIGFRLTTDMVKKEIEGMH